MLPQVLREDHQGCDHGQAQLQQRRHRMVTCTAVLSNDQLFRVYETLSRDRQQDFRTKLQMLTCTQLPTPLNPLPYKDRPTMAILTATEQRTNCLETCSMCNQKRALFCRAKFSQYCKVTLKTKRLFSASERRCAPTSDRHSESEAVLRMLPAQERSAVLTSDGRYEVQHSGQQA